MMPTVPHGFDPSPEDERLLRGPVPPEALHWAAGAFGSGARVRACRALAGGTSSALHSLSIEGTSGRTHRLVLRRFVRLDWLAEEPDLPQREAAALRLLADARLPTPQLVAVDPHGEAAGVPAVLMTMLPGRIEWDPPVLEVFLAKLAQLLPAIHALPVPADLGLPAYAPYRLGIRRPPRWASRPEIWLRAIETLEGPAPLHERLFIHRDYHPGNVLWRREEPSGVVDWVNAGVGSSWADVGHCRVNLAGHFGQPAAELFLDLYRDASGRSDEYHPYWDIVAAIGGLDESSDTEPDPDDERFLAAAVSRL